MFEIKLLSGSQINLAKSTSHMAIDDDFNDHNLLANSTRNPTQLENLKKQTQRSVSKNIIPIKVVEEEEVKGGD